MQLHLPYCCSILKLEIKKKCQENILDEKSCFVMTKMNDSFNLFQPLLESAFLANSSEKVMKLICLAY